MKKTLLAAFFGLTAITGAAHAQSTNVTIYGIIDSGIEFANNGKDSLNRVQSGSLSQSRIGFTGTEDLGGGLRALFTLENGFNVDNGSFAQTGLLFGRQAFVGLGSNAGAVTLGRQYEPLHSMHVKFSTHAVGFGDASAAYVPAIEDVRLDNSIKYVSPVFAGVTLTLFYALGENTTVATDSKSYGNLFNIQANYDNGPLSAAVSYASKKKTPSAPDNITKYLAAAVSYDFVFLKPYLVAETVRNDASSAAIPDYDFWSLAMDVPLGGGRLNFSYGSLKNKSTANANSRSYGVVYDYDLSKRTTLYTGYSRVSNDAGASFGVGSANGNEVAAANAGADPRALIFGLRHKF
ncbi:gram-negative porin family protein [Collimonas fungivorans]|uniref:Gram-negative porin family protein n=1 Tax=Collimonas fungivorans TaxID=158899 RepID=A0A127P6Y8_9BURK|nr:porin [Collimonas fungivorans]AMO93434.1 gram-negative porin family protein [Collimonas fungivorans]